MTEPAALAATHAAAFTQSRPWSATEFAELLAGPGAILTGDARSFTLGRQVADELEILTVATHPDHQRQGLARATLFACEVAARDAGATAAFLEVAEDNTAARALYAAAGYSPVGKRPRYYTRADGPTANALILRKDLTTR